MNSAASDVVSADARHIWHPYTQHLGALPAIHATGASGAYIHTAAGRRIFDAIASWWVTLHGHSHPVIVDAIARQAATLDQVIFTSFTHEPAALFARELVGILPDGLNRIFFSDDGSTAVEVAVKMALQYHANRGSKRSIIVALENAYHGDTFGAMSVSGRGTFTDPFSSLLFDVRRVPDPSSGDTIAALDALLEREGPDVAAIIVEPLLMGAGGMLMYDDGILAAIRERARSNGILFIADEVLTGFGRTGTLFACERAGIAPDIICMSKGLTGGTLPLGATAATDEIFDAFLSEDRHRTLFHGHSYTANPIACAAGRASLTLLDDECARRRQSIHQAHERGLATVTSHPLVRNPRITGTVAAFDLSVGSGYLSPIGKELGAFALERDILLRPLGNVVYVLPPFCATQSELADVWGVIGQFLETI